MLYSAVEEWILYFHDHYSKNIGIHNIISTEYGVDCGTRKKKVR